MERKLKIFWIDSRDSYLRTNSQNPLYLNTISVPPIQDMWIMTSVPPVSLSIKYKKIVEIGGTEWKKLNFNLGGW